MSLVIRHLKNAAAHAWSAAFLAMEDRGPTLFLEDQTATGQGWGQSILCAAPTTWMEVRQGRAIAYPEQVSVEDPLRWMRRHHRPTEEGSSWPFVGGLAGMAGFGLGWDLDNLGVPRPQASTPDLWVGRFDAAALYDPVDSRWAVVGCDDGAVDRLADQINAAPPEPPSLKGTGHFDARSVPRKVYESRVAEAVAAIHRGDFFEVNYSERFAGQWLGDSRALYDGLRQRAPGGFGGLFATPDWSVASISPEQFLCVEADGNVFSRPIKGTRPRGATPQVDRALGQELLASAKDRAENIMIVDLMRNDLTRVCSPGTVAVRELCGLHSFSSVHHLVSTVTGKLAPGCDGLDAFLASFPAGSITGAPKLRTMEWIAEYEATPRGPYTGSFFYWSDHGRFDSNVLIRSALLEGQHVVYGAGGAVVADSDPVQEYEEARWKARPFLDLLERP